MLAHALVTGPSIVRAILQLKELRMGSFAMVLPQRQLHATQRKENSLRKVADLKVWSE